MYRTLLTLLAAVSLSLASQAEKLHVVTFYNTEDPSIGLNKQAEMNRMKNDFQTIATSLEKYGYSSDLYFFDASKCKKDVVINTINTLDVGPDDVVFFYYGGHGGRIREDLEDLFPIMCLAENNPSRWLRLSQVRNLVEKKNPRLAIVMAGCCNSINSGLSLYSSILSAEGPTMESELEKDGFYHLFSDYSGTLTMTSSKAGQESWGTSRGGVFCNVLMDNLANVGNGVYRPEWNEICENIRASVENYFRLTDKKQEPFFISNLQRRDRRPDSAAASASAVPSGPVSSIDPTAAPMETLPMAMRRTLPAPDPDYVNAPIPARKVTVNNLESAYADINSLLDKSVAQEKRMEMVPGILKKHFASDAHVRTLGRNLTTTVDYEDAETFLYRIAMSPFISRINIVEENGGKNSLLTVHEIRSSRK